MRSYLRGRYQRVIVYRNGNKCCSECKEIQYGVPQGSVLGPVLFYYTLMTCQKLYLNYLKPILFADDTSVIISDKDPTNLKIKINKVFDITNEWCATNLLTLIVKKRGFYSFKLKIVKCWIFRLVI
jgi:hypothetical protein